MRSRRYTALPRLYVCVDLLLLLYVGQQYDRNGSQGEGARGVVRRKMEGGAIGGRHFTGRACCLSRRAGHRPSGIYRW